MRDRLAWIALVFISLVLIIVGFQGKMGVLLACLLVPAQVVDDSQF